MKNVLAVEKKFRLPVGRFTVLGFIGILAVFVIGFQRVGLPSLAAIPLLMGVLWTMGLQGLVSGKLTLMTMMFPVLLLGLGIDFAIHIMAAYAACVYAMDRSIGTLVDGLKARGELENTLIVYASDHGEMLGDHGRHHGVGRGRR